MGETNPLATLVGVVDRVRESTTKAMGDASYSVLHPDIAGKSTASPAALSIVATLNDFYANFDQMIATLTKVAGAVQVTMTNPALVPAQRDKDAASLVTVARTSAQHNLTQMTADADKIVRTLTPMAMPPRPPMDATQIAELARRESSIRMLLDSVGTNDLIARLERMLRDAVTAGDTLAVWHLTASGWAELYLESRGLAAWITQWAVSSSEIAAGLLGADAKAARQLLVAVDGSDYNLRTALQAAEFWLRMAFDRLTLVPSR